MYSCSDHKIHLIMAGVDKVEVMDIETLVWSTAASLQAPSPLLLGISNYLYVEITFTCWEDLIKVVL